MATKQQRPAILRESHMHLAHEWHSGSHIRPDLLRLGRVVPALLGTGGSLCAHVCVFVSFLPRVAFRSTKGSNTCRAFHEALDTSKQGHANDFKPAPPVVHAMGCLHRMQHLVTSPAKKVFCLQRHERGSPEIYPSLCDLQTQLTPHSN